MSEEVNLEELRENARTNYGIINADDLEADQLQSEIDAIDKQAEDAKAEDAAAEKARANAADSSATVDQGDATTEAAEKANRALQAAGGSKKDDDEEEAPVFTSANTREELEAEATRLEVEGDVTDRSIYPNKEALVAAIDEANAAGSEEDDDEDEE